MADKTINVRIQQKYDTEANWKAKDPVLLKGEQVFTSDGTNANKYKVGNGTAKWSALPYAKADLSKGDVTTALGYTPPTSNTWRGIQNNLTSGSTTDSLSAAQGKVLKGLVDGKAASSHTHTKSQITDFPTSLPASDVYGWAKASSKPSYTKSEVGLGNVDNTADANKSVKYAGSSGSSNTVVYTALTNTDLNTLQTEGRWYYAGGDNTCTNIPVASAAFELYVGRNASGWRYQQFTVTSGEIYIRVFDSSNWGSWRKLAFTSDTVTAASSVPWSGITGKPSSYTPSSHTHTVSQISGFGTHVYDATISRTANTVLAAPNGKAGSASFRALVAADIPSITKSKIIDFPSSLPASDVYAWAKASSKPSYSWGEITGKPGTFTPSSHTHNYAGSSSAGGSANSAVKLNTARSISIGGFSSGSASFDGSANITIDNWGYGCKKYVTTNSTSAPYFRIAYCDDKSNYSDRSMIFVIDSGYSGGGFGIVKVAFRSNDISKEGQSNCELKWLVRQGFSANQLFVKGNAPAGESQYADLYFKATTTYQAISITVLSMGNRGSKIRVWTFEEGNTRANPDIRKYTYTVEGSDAGTANYANSAGAVAWGNISGKPSTFTPASHTHSYAGAASSGGSANSAIKLDTTTAGSSTQPVYFTGGKPTACTYTLGKSVPSNAVFTDTNTWRPLGTTANTACAGNDSRLSNARPASDVYAWAKASAKPSYSWSEIGSKPSTFTPSSHTHNYLAIYGSRPADINFKTSTNGAGAMFHFVATSSTKTGKPPEDSNVLQMNWDNNGGWDTQFAISNGSSPHSYIRSQNNGTWGNWTTLLDSSNYNNYSPSKTGTGASGTWGINITGASGSCTGNAATASNASKVNGHTVNSDVPSGAKFTDTNTTYPISYRTIDNNFASKYRTQTKGNTSAGDYISTLRCDTNLVPYAPQYGSGLGWGRGDTHGYLYMNYNSPQVYVGAGNADKLNWAKQLAFADHTHSYTEITNRPTLIKAVSKNGYWGMADHDGSDSNWIRTTTAGIIPYQSGGAGAGHCGIGTSSWYFSSAYIDTVNCVNASVSGHIDVGGYIQSSNLINTYFEYQSNRGSVDWRFGAATGTSDENFFGFYDAKTGKIPLALDGNFGNIYVGFNVGSYESPTAVGVYLGGQVAGNRAFIYNGDSYQGSIWIQTRLDGSWKWFSLGRACSTALSDIRLKGNIRDTEVEDATKVIESMKIRSFERKDSHKKYKIGFIADELEQLDPNLVDGGGEVDGHPYYKSVNNLQMLAYVVKGMQELNSKVTILEKENKRLKQKLNMCN